MHRSEVGRRCYKSRNGSQIAKRPANQESLFVAFEDGIPLEGSFSEIDEKDDDNMDKSTHGDARTLYLRQRVQK